MPDSELTRRLGRLGRVVSADQQLTKADRKQLKRKRRREGELRGASVVGGSVMLAVAVALAIAGLLSPDKWWLLFVALGVGIEGGKQIELARRRDRLGLDATPEVVSPALRDPQPPTPDRFEQVCDQLLAELKDSPAAVREFLGKPEATVEALRAACRQLKQRHALLLEAVSANRAADLAQEREALEARLGHLDESTHRQATEALTQRTDLFNQVRAAAERLASEQQILVASLESLRMRVALAKGAGAQAGSLGEMKAAVDRLADELSAITDALESVPKTELQPIAAIEAPEPGVRAAGQREKS